MKLLADRNINILFKKLLLSVVFFSAASVIFSIIMAKNAIVYILLSAFCMAFWMIAACYRYLLGQNERLENAAQQITDYISGNPNARIDCDEEGSLYLLFHRINSLASTLNARAEREEKAGEFLKNTISDISHQLKTPLAALNIYNGILQNETEDLPTIQEFTNLSEQELDRIEALVQNLLKLTKLDAGAAVFDQHIENVSEMMEDVRKQFSFRAMQEGKEIHLAGDRDVELFCDRVWMAEAVGNLVKNALDHTKEGGQIHIEWKNFSSVVQIIVKDDGSGIHPEDLHHIFKRFYRSRFSKDTQGIGLGLPLVKAVAEAHNGTVEVNSNLGNGTAFVINFLIPTKL